MAEAKILVTQFQACVCNIAGFKPILTYSKFRLKPGSSLIKPVPGVQCVRGIFLYEYCTEYCIFFMCEFSMCRHNVL